MSYQNTTFHYIIFFSDASPTYADFFTPLDKKVISTDQKYASDFPKFNLGEDNPSPTPPVFQTPGMNHLGKKENFEKSAPVSAFTSIQKAPMNSPQVPVFQSESVKKMMDKSSVAMEKESSVKTSRAKLYDYMPQTPEFTFNIKVSLFILKIPTFYNILANGNQSTVELVQSDTRVFQHPVTPNKNVWSQSIS